MNRCSGCGCIFFDVLRLCTKPPTFAVFGLARSMPSWPFSWVLSRSSLSICFYRFLAIRKSPRCEASLRLQRASAPPRLSLIAVLACVYSADYTRVLKRPCSFCPCLPSVPWSSSPTHDTSSRTFFPSAVVATSPPVLNSPGLPCLSR